VPIKFVEALVPAFPVVFHWLYAFVHITQMIEMRIIFFMRMDFI